MGLGDLRNSDVRAPGDLGDLFDGTDVKLPPPLNFAVSIAADNQHLQFDISDPNQSIAYRNFTKVGRYRVGSYQVYFAPFSMLPTITNNADAFATANLVDSIDAAPGGKPVSFLNRRFFNQDGWFWCISVSVAGDRSNPTQAVRAPSTASIADAIVPGDVGHPSVSITPQIVNGITVCSIAVSAIQPTNSPSFAGYQIYLFGYYQQNTLEESFFCAASVYSPGQSLSGQFLLQPDSPPSYSNGTVNLVSGNITITANQLPGSNPALYPSWNLSWPNRKIMVIDSSGVSRFATINSIALGPPPTLVASTTGWTNTPNAQYAIFKPDVVAGGFGIRGNPHTVTFYFVAVSKAGTRRPDILNAPSVVLPFGVNTSLNRPVVPTSFGMAGTLVPASSPPEYNTSPGTTVNLSWFWGASNQDTSISQFNIYRIIAGTIASGTTPTRPTSPLATVAFDRSVNFFGQYQYIDKNFNNDPTSINWDFAVNANRYAYWISTVNTDGYESLDSDIENTRIYARLIGVSGGDEHPSVYRDNHWNRLYNATLRLGDGTVGCAGVPINVNKAVGAAYGPLQNTLDGQLTFKYWYTSRFGGTPVNGSNTDDWTVWEFQQQNTAAVAQFICPAAGAISSGEVLLNCGTGGVLDLTGISQIINGSKFLPNENIVLTVFVKGTASLTTGVLNFTIGPCNAAGAYNGNQHTVSFSLTLLTTNYTRFAWNTQLGNTDATHQLIRVDISISNHAHSEGDVKLIEPMINGGAMGAPFTWIMNPEDVPGGNNNPGGTGNTGGQNYPDRCVFSGTPVLTPDGWKEISLLKEGDSVISYRSIGVLVNTILKVHSSESSTVYKISARRGSSMVTIRCTGSHPIARTGRKRRTYTPARELSVGDQVYLADSDGVYRSSVERIEIEYAGTNRVFNFTLSGKPANYVAGGFLSHNKNWQT